MKTFACITAFASLAFCGHHHAPKPPCPPPCVPGLVRILSTHTEFVHTDTPIWMDTTTTTVVKTDGCKIWTESTSISIG